MQYKIVVFNSEGMFQVFSQAEAFKAKRRKNRGEQTTQLYVSSWVLIFQRFYASGIKHKNTE